MTDDEMFQQIESRMDDPTYSYVFESLDQLATGVKDCPRCGGNHAPLIFKSLTLPIFDASGGLYSHWAECPTRKEPVMLTAKLESKPE